MMFRYTLNLWETLQFIPIRVFPLRTFLEQIHLSFESCFIQIILKQNEKIFLIS